MHSRMPYGLCLPARIARVYDVDTWYVRPLDGAREWAVRLLDCWGPELDARDPVAKARAMRGKEFCEKLAADVGDGEVALFVPLPVTRRLLDVLSFNRVLGRLYLPSGSDVADLIVAAGHALPSRPLKAAGPTGDPYALAPGGLA